MSLAKAGLKEKIQIKLAGNHGNIFRPSLRPFVRSNLPFVGIASFEVLGRLELAQQFLLIQRIVSRISYLLLVDAFLLRFGLDRAA